MMSLSLATESYVNRVIAGFTSLLIVLAMFAGIFAQDTAESGEPVFLLEPGTDRALIISADRWRGGIPTTSSGPVLPGSRVLVFVTNLDLLSDEGANAFRIFGQNSQGKRYRFAVESIQQVKRSDIYALTVHLFDANAYNGQPSTNDRINIRVTWRGNESASAGLTFSRKRSPRLKVVREVDPSFVRAATNAKTQQRAAATTGDIRRFMQQATFGPTAALEFRLRQIGFSRWIDEQISKPYPTIPYTNFAQKPFDVFVGCGGDYGTNPEIDLCHRNHYWIFENQKWMLKEALYGEDQLRRRVSWALHQIWVVSARTVYQNRWMQEYVEILDRNAFGNYRNLMKEITLSPAMGEYLDMVRSTRNSPNENYPRELLQLFSVGLFMMNQDGTYILDTQGNRIPTYDQAKIDQFTKVFTGWSQCTSSTNPACANLSVGAPNFIDPMIMQTPSNHDVSAKTLFDYPGAPNAVIAACSNCTNDTNRRAYADDSLNKTLDNIFYHPNVGPFVARLFIQHFVTSDPSAAYVSRVAAAFNNNGAGVRGDMKALIRAVLLDPEARGSKKTDATYGKMREPLQFLSNILRMYNVRAGTHSDGGPSNPPASCGGRSDGVFQWMTSEMGQDVYASSTVFNYFPPDYVVPGTEILGPEFALANTGSSFEKNNYTLYFTMGNGMWLEVPTASNPYPLTPCGTSIDVSELTAIAAADSTGNSLIEALNNKMLHGTMSEAMKTKIRTAIDFNVSADLKARQALFLVASSSQYQIQR